MATSVRTPAVLEPRPRAETIEQSRARPIVWWAVLGAGFVALQMYIQLSWILSDDFRHVGTGATPVPDYMVISARFNEVFFFSFMVGVIYFFAIRPWLRDGRFTLDGLFVLAFFFTWWQDPLFDYVSHAWNYSAVSVNMGGWAGHIPGWSSPNGGNIPEPLLWVLPFYIGLGGAGSILCASAMRRWRARNPRVHTATMLLAVYCAWFLFDLALELFWVRTGLYTYAGAWDHLLLFKGHWYQFPLYEPFCVGFLGLAWTMCRYFVNDRGETLSERGLSRLQVGSKQRQGVRFLALVGILNVAFLLTYSLMTQAFNLHSGAWPKDAQKRSYLTNHLCGPGTSFACGGSDAARPVKEKSVSIGPNGQLVIPPGFDIGKITAPPVSRTAD
jgi:Spirocyclase AveC-like